MFISREVMKNLSNLSFARFCLACAIGIALMLIGCGGGSPTPPAKLVGVSISPTSVSIAVGTTVGLNATGTYSNGKTAYITNQVTWTSASSVIATVGINTGVVTGVSAGSGVPATTFITPTLAGWTLPVVNVKVSTTGGVTASGNFTPGRFDHAAALLTDGRVLVMGGYKANGKALDIAELYDPSPSASLVPWTTTTHLNQGRGDHTATMLNNGKVLVAGGVNTAQIGEPSTELYDPAASSWTPISNLNTTRSYHTATLLTNGKVLLVGGANTVIGILNSAEIYDPAAPSATWVADASLHTKRYSHTATLLANGKVLVVGGFDGSALASVELYTPAVSGPGSWTQLPSLTTARYSHTATLLITGPNAGKVLVVGGSDGINDLASAELYDPANNTWSQVGSLGTPRYNHTASLLPTGQVQVMGGSNANNFNLASVELYTPPASGVQGTWVATHDLVRGRVTHTATLLKPDTNNISKVLVVGGDDLAGPVPDSELYW